MKKISYRIGLMVLLLLQYWSVSAQTFTAQEYEKALWMTTRFYGGQRVGENNWFLSGHLPQELPSDVNYVNLPLSENLRGKNYIGENDNGYDISGGWFDAGDNIVFGETQFYSAYMLLKAYVEFPQGYDDYYSFDYNGYIASGDWTFEGSKGAPNGIPDVVDEVKHATDFFIKCAKDDNTFYYQKGTFQQDHKYWVTAVLNSVLDSGVGGLGRSIKKNPNGASMASFCGASLALMARVYAKYDQAYADQCLVAAKHAYAYAKAHPGVQSGSGAYGSNNNWKDDYATMCAELYWTTGVESYKNEVINYKVGTSNYQTDISFNYSFDYSNNGEIAIYNLALMGHSNAKSVLQDIVTEKYKGNTSNGIYQGGNVGWGPVRYNANSSLIVALNQKLQLNGQLPTSGSQIDQYILDNIDWILGNNSQNTSFIVGFKPTSLNNVGSPSYPHHRNLWLIDNNPASLVGKTIPLKNRQAGLMVGGNRTAFDDNPAKFEHSEGGIDYNACLVGALAYIKAVVSPVDTNKFNAGSKPDLGDDQSICGLSSILLDANVPTDGVKQFTWLKGNAVVKARSKTGNTFEVADAGEYTCVIDSLDEWETSDKILILDQINTPDLGDDFELCKPSVVVLNGSVDGAGLQYEWTKDSETLPETSSSLTIVAAGEYSVIVSASGCSSKSDIITVTSSLPVVKGGSTCNGSIELEVLSEGGPYEWFTDLEGGNSIHEGVTFNVTPSQSTTYYVKDAGSQEVIVGPSSAPCTGTTEQGTRTEQKITAYQDFDLVSAKLMQSSYGGSGEQSFQIELWSDNNNSPGVKLKTGDLSSFKIPAQYASEEITLPINLAITGDASGVSYWLKLISGSDIASMQCSAAYTNNGNGIMDISGSRHDNNTSSNYGMFYNILVSTGSDCDRAPVEANVDCVLDVADGVEVQQYSVSPNPFDDVVSIQGVACDVYVFDVAGKLITRVSKLDATYQLDLSQYPNGIYTLKMINELGVETQRITKQ